MWAQRARRAATASHHILTLQHPSHNKVRSTTKSNALLASQAEYFMSAPRLIIPAPPPSPARPRLMMNTPCMQFTFATARPFQRLCQMQCVCRAYQPHHSQSMQKASLGSATRAHSVSHR